MWVWLMDMWKEIDFWFGLFVGDVVLIVVSFDGCTLVMGSFDGTSRLWDLRIGCFVGVPFVGVLSRFVFVEFDDYW